MKLHCTYFCGNKISEYGIANKRLDYGTLSKAFDAVLVNDITKLFYSSVNGEYIEPEQVNGFIDYNEELEREQDEPREIFQYYIISDNGADIIKRYTNDPLYYIDFLGVYVWGVTHYGTAWSYVLTDTEIEEDAQQ